MTVYDRIQIRIQSSGSIQTLSYDYYYHYFYHHLWALRFLLESINQHDTVSGGAKIKRQGMFSRNCLR